MRQTIPNAIGRELLRGRLRANPILEFVPAASLPNGQLQALHQLIPGFAGGGGVLRPLGGAPGNLKSAPSDVAELWSILRDPQRLPARVETELGEQCNDVITRLVWDGILELEVENEFVSGPQAFELLCHVDPPQSDGRLSHLSKEALQYAQALPPLEPLLLSARLYFFNRIPVSPEWARRFPSSAAVAEHLGIDRGGQINGQLGGRWAPVELPPSGDGWFMWAREEPESRNPRHSLFKLYVSPGGQEMCEVLRLSLRLAAESRCSSFKVGKDVYGLLRTDKLVLYFDEFNDLQNAAERYCRELRGAPVHGVPFTAELEGNGLLSWGSDPPSHEQLRNYGGQSWRLWVTNRLAAALALAKAADLKRAEPWQFALARMTLEGIDTATWAFAENPWSGQAS